ncbi:MAG TPA: M14 family zinc carboxypeptidase, partial [Blastocatellia bacterium]
MRLRLLILALCLIIAGPSAFASQTGLQTKAERTNYSETSRYEDVMQFISALQAESPNVKLESFAVTNEGRKLPLVIFSNSHVKTPTEAAATGKPVVFVMANIHAG